MTGPLGLPGDPVSANQAADKNYVDTNVAAIAAGLGEKVSLVPSATQVVAQPSGTQLEVNNLNGELYASQYATGAGGNGIANAAASPDCASGCTIEAEPTYSGPAANAAVLNNQTAVVDRRGGAVETTAVNPLGAGANTSTAHNLTQIETISAPQLSALLGSGTAVNATALTVTTQALAGGSNLFPEHIESPPYFKNTYGALYLRGVYYTQGQHVQMGNEVDCYGVGDCLAGGQFVYSSGGYRDNADEGAHPFDLQVAEDFRVFDGTCTTGCTAGSTIIAVTPTQDGGTQGDGRFLVDMNPAKTISAGSILSGNVTLFGVVTFTGTSFPSSVFLQTAQVATSQPTNMAPGTVTILLATSGVPTGFATSTATLLSTSGVACVADPDPISNPSPNFEMALYQVVDATHLQLTLNKPHFSGATVAVGGLCGYGMEQKADTVGAIRQVFPVVGSLNATTLYYTDAQVNVVGTPGSTGAFLSVSLPIASVARTAGLVTVTTAAGSNYDLNGLAITVSGVTDSSYNGKFTVASTGNNTFTYTSSGADSTSSGGTLSFSNGAYALYPMAEVLSVFNPATKSVDGTFTLAPNTVAWATGDAIEEPHYYKQLTSPDTELITQYVPRPSQFTTAGKTYLGTVGRGLRGWQVQNGAPASQYTGGGGTHAVPDDAYVALGAWNNDFEVDAGVNAVMRIHCSYLGCNRWNSAYRLFDMDAAVGEDWLSYAPQSSTATWVLGGASYTFSPTALTAATINVGTLNATTINGHLSAAAINGTIPATQLAPMGASGSTHSAGIVPDPGVTVGTSRFLREDGSWAAPTTGPGTSTTSSLASITLGTTTVAAGSTTSALNGVTVDGVGPATLAYVDVTSSVQKQLDNKQPAGNYVTGITGDCTGSGSGIIKVTCNFPAPTKVTIKAPSNPVTISSPPNRFSLLGSGPILGIGFTKNLITSKREYPRAPTSLERSDYSAEFTAGSGAGFGATVTCIGTCNGLRGRLNITTGDSPSAGTVALVTFSRSEPMSCIVTQNGGKAYLGVGWVLAAAATISLTTALPLTGNVEIDYICAP